MTAAEPAVFAPPPVAPPAPRDFLALHREHFGFVWRSLERLGVRAGFVEDAVQDVFVTAYRRLGDLRPDASSRAWLFGIALRVAHNYRRRAIRSNAFVALDDERLASQTTTPFESAAQAEAVALIDRFLASLDEDRRRVFFLIELEQLSAPEVSEALGMKLNTVYSRLRAARALFVQAVDEYHAGDRHE